MYKVISTTFLFVFAQLAYSAVNLSSFSDSVGGVDLNGVNAAAYVFDTEDISSANIQLNNGSQFTAQRAGIYQVSYAVSWETTNLARRQIRTYLQKNGVDIVSSSIVYGYARRSDQAGRDTNDSSSYVELDVGDYVELIHVRNSTVTGTALSIAGEVSLSLEFVEPLNATANVTSPNTYYVQEVNNSIWGITYDGNAFYKLGNAPYFYTSTNLSNWTPVALTGVSASQMSQWRGLEFNGTDLMTYSNNDVFIIDHINGSLKSTFEVNDNDDIRGIAFDGTNLITATSSVIRIHDGISGTIVSSFNSPQNFINGLAYDGTNLIVATDFDKIWVLDGLSSTVLDDYSSVGSQSGDLAFDGVNLLSLNLQGVYGVYAHDGTAEYVGQVDHNF